MIRKILEVHGTMRHCYGSPRMHQELRRQGIETSRKRVERLMRRAGIQGAMPRKRRVRTTISDSRLPVAENLLNRDFSATAPNQKWVSDITYIWTQQGWLYLASVLDLYSRRIVGWSMSAHIDETLVESALLMALGHRQPSKGLVHHSDRGSQYAAKGYQQRLRDWDIVASMSRRGSCWDNAVIESWHRSLKVELIFQQEYQTREQARQSIFEYIEIFYNRQRRHSSIGYDTPVEYENRYRATVS